MENNIIKITIGDWSGDGHEKSKEFYYSTNKTTIEMKNALRETNKVYPELNPQSFANDYEDSTVPDETLKTAKKLGFEFDWLDDDEVFFGPNDMADYIIWCVELGFSLLKDPVEAIFEPVIAEDFMMAGGNFGYGLF